MQCSIRVKLYNKNRCSIRLFVWVGLFNPSNSIKIWQMLTSLFLRTSLSQPPGGAQMSPIVEIDSKPSPALLFALVQDCRPLRRNNADFLLICLPIFYWSFAFLLHFIFLFVLLILFKVFHSVVLIASPKKRKWGIMAKLQTWSFWLIYLGTEDWMLFN